MCSHQMPKFSQASSAHTYVEQVEISVMCGYATHHRHVLSFALVVAAQLTPFYTRGVTAPLRTRESSAVGSEFPKLE